MHYILKFTNRTRKKIKNDQKIWYVTHNCYSILELLTAGSTIRFLSLLQYFSKIRSKGDIQLFLQCSSFARTLEPIMTFSESPSFARLSHMQAGPQPLPPFCSALLLPSTFTGILLGTSSTTYIISMFSVVLSIWRWGIH